MIATLFTYTIIIHQGDISEHREEKMNEDLDFPYIYDDKEDYYTNIDYTSDVTFGKYNYHYL